MPNIKLNYDEVVDKALANSSFNISNTIKSLEAERQVAQNKAGRSVSAEISTQFGLSNNSGGFKQAYTGLMDQEIVGLTVNIPIMDWGMSKGRLKMAQAQAETAKNQIEQAVEDYYQKIFTDVMQFNSQYTQCQISSKSRLLAEERYAINIESFSEQAISITDLNISQTEKDEALRQYMMELRNYWVYYYQLRKQTLYDYINKYDISVEFDQIVQ